MPDSRRNKRPGLFRALVPVLSAAAWTGAALAAGAWETDPQAYSIRLENNRVRVLDVSYPPGYKVRAHTLADRLVLVQSTARLRTEDPSGRRQEFDARAGEVSWQKAETAAVENISESPYRATIIEIKG